MAKPFSGKNYDLEAGFLFYLQQHEMEFWKNDKKYWSSQWKETGNYQLFPRTSLSSQWPDIDTMEN